MFTNPTGAVVIVKNKADPDTPYCYGPFHDGDQATAWAAKECKGLEWHWLPMSRPGSTFLSCDVPEVTDIVESVVKREGTCYVTLDGVNWAVSM